MPENITKRAPKGNVRFSITLSEEQKLAKSNIRNHPFNFVLGKAGSGKTLLAVQIALDCFFKREVNKIVITRPTISNEDNGFLPGSLDEKMEPWLVPIRSNMRKVYNKPNILQKMESDENIELVSLSHFRGRTFDNSIVIVDEFQNLTKQQLAMVLGRLGKQSTIGMTQIATSEASEQVRNQGIEALDRTEISGLTKAVEGFTNFSDEALIKVMSDRTKATNFFQAVTDLKFLVFAITNERSGKSTSELG